MALYRILSFDGGGIRGLLSAVLLRRLVDESTVSDLIAQADMFAGTSTGGLIALGLAADIPLEEIETTHFQCHQLLGESQYCRVQPIFEEDYYRMDSVGLIPEMMAFANNKVDLSQAVDWVGRNWRREGWIRILGQNSPKRRFS